jgi:hypothetical protein
MALLLATTAPAEPVRPHELSLGITSFTFLSYLRSSAGFTAVEAAYHWRVSREGGWSALRLGGGLRTGIPASATRVPLEGFLQVQLSARHGRWEAWVGPELGVSGFAKLETQTLVPLWQLKALEDERFGPVYASFTAAPIRLHFGRAVVSALELSLGTNLSAPGAAVRAQLGLLRLGMEL